MNIKTIFQPDKYLALVFIFLISITAYTQEYQSVIASDSVSWDIAHQELFGIVTEKLYCKKHPDSLFSNLFLFGLFPDTTLVGSVREDLDNSKVWFRNPSSMDEILIMDMDLEVGDIFEIQPGSWNTVDSVFYFEGRKYIRFDLNTDWGEPVTFIEGVGPNIGLFYPISYFDDHYAACKYNQFELVYINSNINFNGCEPKPVGIIDNVGEFDVHIYPNPAESFLYVDLPHICKNETKLEILDLCGRIYVSTMLYERRNQIEIDFLNSGSYIFRLINDKQQLNQLIIVKN